MDNNSQRLLDYFFREYFQNNQYDIKKLIINKTTKFKSNVCWKRNYLAWQGCIEIWRTMQRVAFLFCWWFAGALFGLLFIFIGSIDIAVGYSSIHTYLNTCTWSFFGAFWFFFLLGCFLYFYPIYRYIKMKEQYLPTLISIFEKMQREGYINPNIKDYPHTIQVIYYHGKWYKAKWDNDYPFKHYCIWFGFLALRYFINEYDKLTFPLTNENNSQTK